MSTNQESIHTTEVNITVTSEQLADDSYVKKLLVTTKMKVLAEIAACNDSSVSDMVKEYCPEVYNYSDILEKYTITPAESNKKKKPKLLTKKKKPMVKKITDETSKSTEISDTPVTITAKTTEPSSPKPSTPVPATTTEPSSPKPSTPVTIAAKTTEPSSPKPTKQTKKKILKKKPKSKPS